MAIPTGPTGPAAQLIDFGYAVKLPLSKLVDSAWGIDHSHALSLTGFLNACYEMRRPMFVFTDMFFAPFSTG